MNCREFADFLDQYFENVLPASERAEFDRHLDVCPACRIYLDGYQKTVKALRACSHEFLNTEAAPDELIDAILAAHQAGASSRRID